MTRAFLKRIIYLFDRYSVSKKSVCGGLFRQNTFPLLANIGVLRAGRALPLYLLTPAGRPGKRAGKPCRARLPNPPQMSARQAARWKRAACPALARVSFSKSKIWRRNRGFGIQLGGPASPPNLLTAGAESAARRYAPLRTTSRVSRARRALETLARSGTGANPHPCRGGSERSHARALETLTPGRKEAAPSPAMGKGTARHCFLNSQFFQSA